MHQREIRLPEGNQSWQHSESSGSPICSDFVAKSRWQIIICATSSSESAIRLHRSRYWFQATIQCFVLKQQSSWCVDETEDERAFAGWSPVVWQSVFCVSCASIESRIYWRRPPRKSEQANIQGKLGERSKYTLDRSSETGKSISDGQRAVQKSIHNAEQLLVTNWRQPRETDLKPNLRSIR
jgi:hypothetical protein